MQKDLSKSVDIVKTAQNHGVKKGKLLTKDHNTFLFAASETEATAFIQETLQEPFQQENRFMIKHNEC